MNLELRVGNFISEFDLVEWDEARIEELEDALKLAQERYLEEPTPNKLGSGYFLDDSLYDIAIERLRRLKPDSPVANQIWESAEGTEDVDVDLDRLLVEFPMKSITTIKGFNTPEFEGFRRRVGSDEFDMLASYKLNGWGIRFVYSDGKFVRATSRMRHSKGIDLTRLVGNVLAKYNLLEIPSLRGSSLVEFRGELMLPNSKLEQARSYNASIVNPLYAVNSLRGEKMPKEAHELLDIYVYRVLESGVSWANKKDEYEYIKKLGFKNPPYFLVEGFSVKTLENDFEEVLDALAEGVSRLDLFTDGIVLQILDSQKYSSMGGTDLSDYASVALKMGLWEQNHYTGVVQCVIWTKGKSKLSPVVLVGSERDIVEFKVGGKRYKGFHHLRDNYEDFASIQADLDKYIVNMDELGIPTASGSVVRRVPCYNSSVLFTLDIQVGGSLSFYYGGESGVVPCDAFGNLVKDSVDLKPLISSEKSR